MNSVDLKGKKFWIFISSLILLVVGVATFFIVSKKSKVEISESLVLSEVEMILENCVVDYKNSIIFPCDIFPNSGGGPEFQNLVNSDDINQFSEFQMFQYEVYQFYKKLDAGYSKTYDYNFKYGYNKDFISDSISIVYFDKGNRFVELELKDPVILEIEFLGAETLEKDEIDFAIEKYMSIYVDKKLISIEKIEEIKEIYKKKIEKVMKDYYFIDVKFL